MESAHFLQAVFAPVEQRCQDQQARKQIKEIEDQLAAIRKTLRQGQGTRALAQEMGQLLRKKNALEREVFPDLFLDEEI